MASVRIIQVAASCLTGMFLLAPLGSKAQISGIQVQAANVARMRAESLNGGLSKYFAANCMHERGGGDCLIKVDNQGFLFRFAGGPPGWQTNHNAATVETEILVAPDGKTVVNASNRSAN